MRCCQILFFVDASYLIAILGDEIVEAFHRRLFCIPRPDVENLSYRTVLPGFDLDLDAGRGPAEARLPSWLT